MEQCWKAMPFDRPRMEQVVQSMKKGNFGAP
jgi:hypothetical protein